MEQEFQEEMLPLLLAYGAGGCAQRGGNDGAYVKRFECK